MAHELISSLCCNLSSLIAQFYLMPVCQSPYFLGFNENILNFYKIRTGYVQLSPSRDVFTDFADLYQLLIGCRHPAVNVTTLYLNHQVHVTCYLYYLSNGIIISELLLQILCQLEPQLSQLVLILILISIKTRIDHIFGQKPPHPTTPPGTQPCLILPKQLTFEVIHQNKSCLSILEQSKNNASCIYVSSKRKKFIVFKLSDGKH